MPSVTQRRTVDAVMVDITNQYVNDLNHQMFHHQKKKDVDDAPETKEQVRENNTRTSTAIDEPDQSTMTATKTRHKVLLQTAVTYAQAMNGSNPIPMLVLLDSGSQRSYITNSLKKRLSLVPMKTETLNLNTFGDEHFTKQRCDMVQLSLKGKSGNRRITALCFVNICSPSTTTVDLGRYPHLQGLRLSDLNILEDKLIAVSIFSLVQTITSTSSLVRCYEGKVAPLPSTARLDGWFLAQRMTLKCFLKSLE